MHFICGYSGGLSSHLAAHRIIEEVGAENVTLLFADTKSEDADSYRFVEQGSAALGARLVQVCDGRTIWGVMRDERFLANSRVDPCSKILKREAMDRWVGQNFTPDNCTHVIGYHACEPGRFERLVERFRPWTVRAPLMESPTVKAEEVRPEFERLFPGIRVPRLYDLGSEHNNCGGLCVKAGQRQFAWALRVIPEKFAEWEREEQAMREYLGRDDISILTDRRGGQKRPMTLQQFRQRLETGCGFNEADRGQPCMCAG